MPAIALLCDWMTVVQSILGKNVRSLYQSYTNGASGASRSSALSVWPIAHINYQRAVWQKSDLRAKRGHANRFSAVRIPYCIRKHSFLS